MAKRSSKSDEDRVNYQSSETLPDLFKPVMGSESTKGSCLPLLNPGGLLSSDTDTESSSGSASSDGSGNKINTWMLVGLIYYSVSGGPLGMEGAVRAGGPALALLGFLVFPLIWSLPEAAMTAELSVAYPEAAGFGAWTNAAFGPFWSFLCSLLSYFSGVLDNAVYPVLMLSYIEGNEGVDEISTTVRWSAILCFTALMTALTWRGLDVNGTACILLVAFVLLPFAVFSVAALPQVRVSNWFLGPRDRSTSNQGDDQSQGESEYAESGDWFADVEWRTLLNILFWNLNYYDSASAFSGDCRDPARTFPKAMGWALAAVSLSYLIPLAVASGADPTARYCDGCFVAIASDLVGPWLGAWITVAAAVSCVGLFIAEMASDSFMIMGIADNGQLPSFLCVRSRFGTPTAGVLLSACGVVAASQLHFTAIVELVNILYVFSALIEYAAFVKLRFDASPGRSSGHDLTSPCATTALQETVCEPATAATTTSPAVDTAAASSRSTLPPQSTSLTSPEPSVSPPTWQIPFVDTWWKAALFFTPASTMLLAVLFLSSVLSFVVAGVAAGFTIACYLLTCVAREKRWLAFEAIGEGWGVHHDPAFVQLLVRKLGAWLTDDDDSGAHAEVAFNRMATSDLPVDDKDGDDEVAPLHSNAPSSSSPLTDRAASSI